MEELRLPRKTLNLWKIRVTIAVLLFFGVFSYFFHSYDWFLPATLVVICLYEALFLWYLPNLFKGYRIKYVNGAVVIESGVIIKMTHIMPYSKMIYAESITSPLAKAMGLSAVILKAARSRILIPELPANDTAKFIKALAEGEK